MHLSFSSTGLQGEEKERPDDERPRPTAAAVQSEHRTRACKEVNNTYPPGLVMCVQSLQKYTSLNRFGAICLVIMSWHSACYLLA